MGDAPDVQLMLSSISDKLDDTEKTAAEYKGAYDKYEYLWTTDLPGMFAEFLKGALVLIERALPEGGGDGEGSLDGGGGAQDVDDEDPDEDVQKSSEAKRQCRELLESNTNTVCLFLLERYFAPQDPTKRIQKFFIEYYSFKTVISVPDIVANHVQRDVRLGW